jgi:GntR family transcriptional regulator
MNPLNPQSSRALHLQLADELRSEIRRGVLAAGERLPPERELAERYLTSRTTVIKGLAVLKTEGLVGSGHGRGTFVRRNPPVRLAFARFSRTQRLPGMGPWETATKRAGVQGEARMLTVEHQLADAELAHRLEIEPGAPVFLRSRLMLAAGYPMQIQSAWYPAALVEDSELARPGKIVDGVYAALERIGHQPVSASEEVCGRAATPEESDTLRLSVGIPVLVVTRVTRDADRRVLEFLEVICSGEATILAYEDLPLI